MTALDTLQSKLGHFTGTGDWHQSCIFTRDLVMHTDGIQFVAKEAGAYWLLDLIASHYRSLAKWLTHTEGFATITLKGNKTGNGAKVIVGDGNDEKRTLQAIPFTDFPFEGFPDREFVMFMGWDGRKITVYLPSEH